MKKLNSLIIICLLIFTACFIAAESTSRKIEKEKNELGLSNSAWPNYGGNYRNTRRSPYNTNHVDGETKWCTGELSHHKGGAPLVGDGGAVIDNDGTIYYQTMFYLRAVNQDATLKWEYRIIKRNTIRDTEACVSPAIASDGTIYAGTATGKFHAVRPNGTLKWTFEADGPIGHSPNIGHDGTVYFTSDDTFYALNPNGTQKWNYTSESSFSRSSPTIGDDGTIYVDEYAFYSNGTLKWDSYGDAWITPAIAEDGTIYNFQYDGTLYALYHNGTIKWKYKTDGGGTAPAIGEDGTIYLTAGENFIALNTNGSLKWKYYTGRYWENSPTIGGDGTIYLINGGGTFYAINPNGTLEWKDQIDGNWEHYRSPIIDSDGNVYIYRSTSSKMGLLIYGEEGPDFDEDDGLFTPGFSFPVLICVSVIMAIIWNYKKINFQSKNKNQVIQEKKMTNNTGKLLRI